MDYYDNGLQLDYNFHYCVLQIDIFSYLNLQYLAMSNKTLVFLGSNPLDFAFIP